MAKWSYLAAGQQSGLVDALCQASINNPSMRLNSAALYVTSVTPRLRAIAVIFTSFGPIPIFIGPTRELQ